MLSDRTLSSAVLLCTLLCPATSLSAFPACRNADDNGNIKPKNVAIIGAGAAGASTAYYLKKFEQRCHPVNITVYESSDYVGGRSITVDLFDDKSQPVELGASIFVEVNRNLVSAAKELGLTIEAAEVSSRRASPTTSETADYLGIWDGESFRYRQSEPSLSYWNLGQMLWKYGLSTIRTQSLAKQIVAKFLKLYEPPYFPFRSLSQAVQDVELLDPLSMPGDQFLEKNSIFAPFSTDIIQASTRVNYAQNLDQIHGLETMVCMSTEGAQAVSGGNWRIFAGMIKSAEAHLQLSTAVSAVTKNPDETYTIASGSSNTGSSTFNTTSTQDFDTIILSAPFQSAKITLTPPPPILPKKIRYVRLHVTLFTSPHALSPTYFFLPASSLAPATILTTRPPNTSSPPLPFFSISTLRQVFNPSYSPPRLEYAYKIFSPAPLTAGFLAQVLDLPVPARPEADITAMAQQDVSWSHEKAWDSYPYLPPRVEFDGPELDTGLWYTSGVESFISTMETSSWMGRNVARLIVDDWAEAEAEAEAGSSVGKKQVEEDDVVGELDEEMEKEREWLGSKQERLGFERR